MIESGTVSSLSQTGSITFTDIDSRDRVSISEALKSISGTKRDSSVLSISSVNQSLIKDAFSTNVDNTSTNNGTINWDYAITQANINFLGAGESVTAVFTVSITNNVGQESSQDVTITLTGQNKARQR